MKIRFIEPGNRPYKPTILNYFVYDRYIRTPSVGLNTLATIVKREYPDTYMYSESISKIPMKDLQDANIIFISIFTSCGGSRVSDRNIFEGAYECNHCDGWVTCIHECERSSELLRLCDAG